MGGKTEMKRLTILSVVLMLFAMGTGAQSQPSAQTGASATSNTAVSADRSGAQAASSSTAAASAQAGNDPTGLASSTAMQATLSHPVDCKKNKPGDAVTAKNTEALTSNGQVVIPKGSRLVGHITEARQHEKKGKNKQGQDSALGIAWDKAILRNGQEVPLNVSIQALAIAQGQASSTINDAEMPIGGSAMASGSGSGRGMLGGVGATGSGALGAATQPVGAVGSAAGGAVTSTTRGAVGSTASGAASATGTTTGTVGGLNAAGQFVSNSRGVFGLNGLSLTSAVSNSTEGSLITSGTQNVHLDSGTRMLLVVQGQTEGSATGAQSSGSRVSHEPKQPRGENPSGARTEYKDQQP
jgi:hypothetical protein